MAEPVGRYRSLTAAGLGAEAVRTIVTSALRAVDGLTVHEVAPGRLSVSRTRRPTWALVACAATVWIGGLGLLFLLVTRTEAGEVTVSDGPRGCTLTLPPLLDASAVQAVEQALRAGGATGSIGDDPFAVRPVDDDLEGRTVARRAVAGPADGADPATAAMPAGPPTTPPQAVLRFDGGTVVVAVGRPVVLGRDPSGTGDAVGHRVPGDATTVSKSHLLVTFDGVTVVVEDLGSTNGTTLEHADTTRTLAPGERTVVADGDRISLGALTCAVDARPAAREEDPAWS